MFRLILALPLALLIACGGGDPEPLTLDAYIADWCGSDAGPDLETWGEFAERGRAFIDDGRDVLPPPAIAGYHNARVQGAQLLVTAAEEQNPDDVATGWGFIGVAAPVNALVEEAIASLPDAERERLAAAECWGFGD